MNKSHVLRLLGVISFVATGLIPATEAMAAPPDMSSWSAYKTITGTSTSNQTAINLHLASGTDNSTDIYLNNLSRSDFADVRFTDSTASNLLDYYESRPSTLIGGGTSRPVYAGYSGPQAVSYNGSTYVVWQGGKIMPAAWIADINNTTQAVTGPVELGDSRIVNDDHGVPIVYVDTSGFVNAIWGGYRTSDPTRHAVSVNPQDIRTWTQLADVSTNASYPKFLRTTGNDAYLFTRGTDGGGNDTYLQVQKSTDGGRTFAAATVVVTVNTTSYGPLYAGNPQYDSANNTIHWAWTRFINALNLRQSLYSAYWNLTNNHWYNDSGTDLGTDINEAEMEASTKVLSQSQLTQDSVQIPVIQLDESGYVWMMSSINSSGTTEFAWAHFNGSAWSSFTQVAPATSTFSWFDFSMGSSTNATVYYSPNGVLATSMLGGIPNGDIATKTWSGSWGSATTIVTRTSSGYNLPVIPQGTGSPIRLVFWETNSGNWTDNDLGTYTWNGTTVSRIQPDSAARFYVHLPSTGAFTIRVYYGNASAASLSTTSIFQYADDGSTGNFTSATAFGGTVTHSQGLITIGETSSVTDAAALGTVVTGNFTAELRDWLTGWGNPDDQFWFGLYDQATTTVGNFTPTFANTRAGVQRYTGPGNGSLYADMIRVSYMDGAGTLHSWNGSAAWQANNNYRWTVNGPVDVTISVSTTTIYIDVTQNGASVISGPASIALASVKAFATGKVVQLGDPISDFYRTNVYASAMFVRPAVVLPEQPISSISAQFPDSPPTLTTLPTTAISMTKDAVVTGNFSGNLTGMGNAPGVVTHFDYGDTIAYGQATSNVTMGAIGVENVAFSTSALTPGVAAHARFVGTTANATTNGNDVTITLTMPTMTTGSYSKFGGNSAVLTGSVSSMGVASDTYVSIRWGYDTSYGQTTSESTAVAIGDFTKTITFSPIKQVHYQTVARVGTTYSYGGDQTIPIDTSTDTTVFLIAPLGLLLILFFTIASSMEVEMSPIMVIVIIVILGAIIQMVSGGFIGLF